MTQLDTNQKIETALSFHPDWDVPAEDRYVFQYHHMQLKPLEPNQLSIQSIDCIDGEEFVIITAFIRSSLDKPIRLEDVNLILLDEEKNSIARKKFELDGLGELPACSCRPWRFIFEKHELNETFDKNGAWSLAFEIQKRIKPSDHRLELSESWNESLSTDQKTQLEALLSQLPVLNPGEVNIMGIQGTENADQSLTISLLIRNGSENNLEISQLPLHVLNSEGEQIAAGSFNLEGLTVQSNTSKPWSFTFPKEMVNQEKLPLTTWKVVIPQA
jgi:accessory Sec system S-layer assembly protein